MDENVSRVEAVLQEACQHISCHYEVDDLCSSLPDRLKSLSETKGERLKH